MAFDPGEGKVVKPGGIRRACEFELQSMTVGELKKELGQLQLWLSDVVAFMDAKLDGDQELTLKKAPGD